MAKETIEIRGYFMKHGRPIRDDDPSSGSKRGQIMGYGMSRSELGGLGASISDIDLAVENKIIEKCYMRLSRYSMEAFYFARPNADEKIVREAIMHAALSQVGLPAPVENPQPASEV